MVFLHILLNVGRVVVMGYEDAARVYLRQSIMR